MTAIHQAQERRQSDYCVTGGDLQLQRHSKHLTKDLNLSRHNSIERSQNIVLSRRSSHGLGHKLGPLQLDYNRDGDFEGFPGLVRFKLHLYDSFLFIPKEARLLNFA